jgi:RHS repeat-associated protein
MGIARIALTLLAFAAVSLNLHAATSTLPAPLPELMNDAQAAKWTADQAAAAQATSVQEPSTQFYTGKPYVADAGGYIYKYRTYNPEMSRWTSADPSGFPDGVNNQVYAPNAKSQLDSDGLKVWQLEMTTTGNLTSSDPGQAYGWSGSVAVGSNTLEGIGTVDVSIAPNTPSSSATMSGYAVATYDGTSVDISQSYNVSIDSSTGDITITGSGTDNKGSSVSISEAGAISGNGTQSVSFTYSAAALLTPTGINGIGVTVAGTGGNITWTSDTGHVSGSEPVITFTAE